MLACSIELDGFLLVRGRLAWPGCGGGVSVQRHGGGWETEFSFFQSVCFFITG